MSDSVHPEADKPIDNSSSTAAPYEAALTIAFNKLTSQIFIFLLAYMILVIGLTVFGPGLVSELRLLLYVLPAIGILGYLAIQRRNIASEAQSEGIDLGAIWTVGGSEVIGSEGGATSGNIKIRTGFTGGKSKVYGSRQPPAEIPETASVTYLNELFEQLPKPDQMTLITMAHGLLVKSRNELANDSTMG